MVTDDAQASLTHASIVLVVRRWIGSSSQVTLEVPGWVWEATRSLTKYPLATLAPPPASGMVVTRPRGS